jgi:hypothetical protein
MPKFSESYKDPRSKEELIGAIKIACVANDFGVTEAVDELLAKKSMGLSSWPITLSVKLVRGDSDESTTVFLNGEIGGVGPIQSSHLKKSIQKVVSRAGLSPASGTASAAGSLSEPVSSLAGSTGTPLSEKPLGFVLAVLGGLPAAPIGLVASPLVLFLLGKRLESSPGAKPPQRFLWWAAIGVVGLPLSFALNSAVFPGIYSSSTSTASSSSSSSTPTAPAPAPEPAPVVSEKWDSDANRRALEESIVESATDYQTGSETPVKSAECKATAEKDFWNCSVRYLGDANAYPVRVEFDTNTGKWVSTPL